MLHVWQDASRITGYPASQRQHVFHFLNYATLLSLLACCVTHCLDDMFGLLHNEWFVYSLKLSSTWITNWPIEVVNFSSDKQRHFFKTSAVLFLIVIEEIKQWTENVHEEIVSFFKAFWVLNKMPFLYLQHTPRNSLLRSCWKLFK